jgi:hypothetical protein
MSDAPSQKNQAQPDPLRDGEVVRQAMHRRLSMHASLPDDQKFQNKYPALWSWATFQDISEEKAKERPSFSFRVSEGQWVLSISDPSMAASLSATATTFEGCLEGLNKLLGRADTAWAPWRGKEAKLKQKVKPK